MVSPTNRSEVYFEFVILGSTVKVTAIDPVTGIEAVVIGPSQESARSALRVAALRKLDYLINKKF